MHDVKYGIDGVASCIGIKVLYGNWYYNTTVVIDVGGSVNPYPTEQYVTVDDIMLRCIILLIYYSTVASL